jgi:hypothetical protein
MSFVDRARGRMTSVLLVPRAASPVRLTGPIGTDTGGRSNIVQHYRTIVTNNPPAPAVLLEGEIGIEMNDPMRLWIGVPAELDSTQRKLLFDKSQGAWQEAPTDGRLYGRNGQLAQWLPSLPISGGTLTGALTLAADPAGPLQPVSLQYYTAHLPAASSTQPVMDGAGNAGSSAAWSRGDHVHPSDASRLPLTGGTLTGPLTLPGNAAANLQAVPLQQLNSAVALYLPLAGGVMTGALTLSGNAAANLQPVSLQQMNAAIAAVPIANYLPLAGGTLTGGLHFGSANASSTTDLTRHLDLYGGTFGLNVFSGQIGIVVPAGNSITLYAGGTNLITAAASGVTMGAPLNNLAHATSLNALNFGNTGSGFYLQTTNNNANPGISATGGSFVLQVVGSQGFNFRSTGGMLFQAIDGVAGAAPGNWIFVYSAAAGSPVPIDTYDPAGCIFNHPVQLAADPTVALGAATKQYVDNSVAPLGSSNAANVGRNFVDNPYFNVQQRGQGPWTVGASYTADRWQLSIGGSDTASASIVALTDADRAAIGDESAESALQITFTGSSVAGSDTALTHGMEDVRRTSNRTVIVSFWAKASVAMQIQPTIIQTFGTGGSPSGAVFGGYYYAALTTAWQRFYGAMVLPSIAGKVIGTNPNTSFAQLILYLSAQGGTGVNAGTVTVWGVTVEPAATGQTLPSPLEHRSLGEDLRRCQRYCSLLGILTGSGYGIAGQTVEMPFTFPQMRQQPNVAAVTWGTNTNITSPQIYAFGNNCGCFYGTVTATGIFAFNANTILLSADF